MLRRVCGYTLKRTLTRQAKPWAPHGSVYAVCTRPRPAFQSVRTIASTRIIAEQNSTGKPTRPDQPSSSAAQTKEKAEEAEEVEEEVSAIEEINPHDYPDLFPELAHNEEAGLEEAGEESAEATSADGDWYVDEAFERKEAQAPLWVRRQKEIQKPLDVSDGSLFSMCQRVIERDVVPTIIDVSQKCDWTSKLVIAEAKGTRHMRAIAEDLIKAIKQRRREMGHGSESDMYISVDGKDSDDWIVMDLGSFVVHVMTPEACAKYDLVSLWTQEQQPVAEAVAEAGPVTEAGPEENKPE